VRKLSKRTQRALGELTKVSEERLGNVRTAQSFNGEIQEVHRYNKKIRDLFDLGKKEVSPALKQTDFRVLLMHFSSVVYGLMFTLLTIVWTGGKYNRSDGTCSWRPDGLIRIYHNWTIELFSVVYYLCGEQHLWTFILLQ
jgi:putative ABC transport system ATP-binding protein